MTIEASIRSRLEAILVNDARNYQELQKFAAEDGTFELDPFAEERNSYHRIINGYRSAVHELSRQLDEGVSFLSGFIHIVETIRDRTEFQDICARIVDCVLQDFGAEYCGLIFHESADASGSSSHLEGVCEERRILFVHSNPALFGSARFERILLETLGGAEEPFVCADVYREPRFNGIDFPSVVRSLACIPLLGDREPVGAMILSHSLPRHFKENHLRVLRILAGMITHLSVLTGRRGTSPACRPATASASGAGCRKGVLSVALLGLVREDETGRAAPVSQDELASIRSCLLSVLEDREAAVIHGDGEILILMPGVPDERAIEKMRLWQGSFESWRDDLKTRRQGIRMSISMATGDDGEGLYRMLENAAGVIPVAYDGDIS